MKKRKILLNFPLMYQGYDKLDNRNINYFSLRKEEALNYGNNVRLVKIQLFNPLLKKSDIYYDLNNEFREKDKEHKLFDFLDNSNEGIKRQERFFRFLKKKGYDGLSNIHENNEFSPSIDSQYVIVFNKKSFEEIPEKDLDFLTAWMIKEINTHATKNDTKVYLFTLTEIFKNYKLDEDTHENVSLTLNEHDIKFSLKQSDERTPFSILFNF